MDSIENSAFTNRAIAIEELPAYEELSFNSVSIKQRTKGFIQVSIFLFICLIGLGFGFYFEMPEILFYIAIPIISFISLFSYINIFLLQKTYGYALREKDIIYKRGYITQKTTIVPFNRIQHVSTSRGFIDKILGIANLKIFTAGGHGSDIKIPGLMPDLAQKLKEAVAKKVSLEDEQ
ncbi:PH domain-containing protein [Mesonia maritima]|uniref:YdbS-like PH domain-containing protein n=1 Tax=Mesonia maritima TaxID=1793873 RepID=A0ABU1K820_9FLAO|nr:PH domain-containing protein [Mesonia maritima]MDR6301405.1 hypothetical protein [Mesonia maritima]